MSSLHPELKALIWTMDTMLQHTNCQHFRIDYKDIISMTLDSKAWGAKHCFKEDF